jgi:tRNA dimethylallyltransferase
MNAAPEILIITGPTACGKSSLALSIAQKRAEQNKNSVIINADSQQVYHELQILSARPSLEEENLVPHRLYGFIPVSESFSVGKWLKFVRMEIDWALSQGFLPIIVGGTGLYIKALLEGLAEIPEIPDAVRDQASNDYDAMGKEAFSERLRAVDPAFFERLKVVDRQRLIRAYSVWLGSGKSLSWWQSKGEQPAYPPEYFTYYQMELPREELYRRCNARFDIMMEQGALEEVRELLLMGIPPDAPSMKSVGIKELSAYLKKEISIDNAIDAAKQATRNYAKRQLTWLRNQTSLKTSVKNAVIINSEAIIAEILMKS